MRQVGLSGRSRGPSPRAGGVNQRRRFPAARDLPMVIPDARGVTARARGFAGRG
jgi:hypothetical protein